MTGMSFRRLRSLMRRIKKWIGKDLRLRISSWSWGTFFCQVARRERFFSIPLEVNWQAWPLFRKSTGIVVALGAILSVAGHFAIKEYANARLQQEFDQEALNVSSRITKALDRHVEISRAAAALFSRPKESVSRWKFYEFMRGVPEKHPGLRSIEWIPKVPHGRRSALEEQANKDGLFDFHFMELGPEGGRGKAKERPEYYPIYFIEPYKGNEALLGLDLAADPKAVQFFAEVRDRGKATIATENVFSGTGENGSGFSVVLPVYQSEIPPFSQAERRKALSGFIRAKFSFEKFSQSLLAGAEGSLPVKVYIFHEEMAKETPLVHFIPSAGVARLRPNMNLKDLKGGVFASVQHEVAGTEWDIVLKPVPGVFQKLLGIAAWGFVVFTILLTALLLRHLSVIHRAREKAEAANRAKSEFLAMMSHELRTPLNSVIGFSEVMMKELRGPLNNNDYKGYTENIHQSATILLGLINNILDLSKIEAGYFNLEKKNFAIRDIWNLIYPLLLESYRESNLELEENVSKSDLVLYGDPRVFGQIVHNLASNAMKFTPAGGKVTVSAFTDKDGHFKLEVADTGIGIAREDQELVLTPFRQVDNSFSRKYEGVGLGLPLTRKLVELHGGTLTIESELHKGTKIIVDLPATSVVSEGLSPESQDTHLAVKKGYQLYGQTTKRKVAVQNK